MTAMIAIRHDTIKNVVGASLSEPHIDKQYVQRVYVVVVPHVLP